MRHHALHYGAQRSVQPLHPQNSTLRSFRSDISSNVSFGRPLMALPPSVEAIVAFPSTIYCAGSRSTSVASYRFFRYRASGRVNGAQQLTTRGCDESLLEPTSRPSPQWLPMLLTWSNIYIFTLDVWPRAQDAVTSGHTAQLIAACGDRLGCEFVGSATDLCRQVVVAGVRQPLPCWV